MLRSLSGGRRRLHEVRLTPGPAAQIPGCLAHGAPLNTGGGPAGGAHVYWRLFARTLMGCHAACGRCPPRRPMPSPCTSLGSSAGRHSGRLCGQLGSRRAAAGRRPARAARPTHPPSRPPPAHGQIRHLLPRRMHGIPAPVGAAGRSTRPGQGSVLSARSVEARRAERLSGGGRVHRVPEARHSVGVSICRSFAGGPVLSQPPADPGQFRGACCCTGAGEDASEAVPDCWQRLNAQNAWQAHTSGLVSRTGSLPSHVH